VLLVFFYNHITASRFLLCSCRTDPVPPKLLSSCLCFYNITTLLFLKGSAIFLQSFHRIAVSVMQLPHCSCASWKSYHPVNVFIISPLCGFWKVVLLFYNHITASRFLLCSCRTAPVHPENPIILFMFYIMSPLCGFWKVVLFFLQSYHRFAVSVMQLPHCSCAS
jgi:hypothetical protein